MRKVQIDRQTWLRGGKTMEIPNPDYDPDYDYEPKFLYEDSMLLREDGMMCCIGQACARLGVPTETLLNLVNVDDLISVDRAVVPEEFTKVKADSLLDEAYSINDTDSTTDEEKEAKLIPLFAEMGLIAEFIN